MHTGGACTPAAHALQGYPWSLALSNHYARVQGSAAYVRMNSRLSGSCRAASGLACKVEWASANSTIMLSAVSMLSRSVAVVACLHAAYPVQLSAIMECFSLFSTVQASTSAFTFGRFATRCGPAPLKAHCDGSVLTK